MEVRRRGVELFEDRPDQLVVLRGVQRQPYARVFLVEAALDSQEPEAIRVLVDVQGDVLVIDRILRQAGHFLEHRAREHLDVHAVRVGPAEDVRAVIDVVGKERLDDTIDDGWVDERGVAGRLDNHVRLGRAGSGEHMVEHVLLASAEAAHAETARQLLDPVAGRIAARRDDDVVDAGRSAQALDHVLEKRATRGLEEDLAR